MKSFLLNNVLPVLSLVLLTVVVASAQPGIGGPMGTLTVAPIDGGVSFLLAGGVAYGMRKLRAARLKKA